jgi:hypothetical protein
MQGSEFRGLAEAVTRAYGDDPWYFLRELAQNSRDAGARAIRVEAQAQAGGSETIVFADDGRGMTLAHARRFLFRLHASDKGGDPAAAGRYGVGFWTVLRFAPSLIRIESRRGDESWAVELDAGLAARADACRRSASGTTVTLVRSARCASPEEFSRQLGEGLRAYCRYLRRNDRRGSPLSLLYGGSELTEPMALPGPLSLRFRSGPVEGAVGLADTPEVSLYARGLPVWRGAALDQMSVLNVDAAGRTDLGGGLAPVYLLNGNHLDVTFSRNLAVENRALALVRRKAEAALRRLLEASLQRVFPRRWPGRLLGRLGACGRGLLRPGWLWLPLVALALLLPALLALPRGTAAVAPDWFSLEAAPSSYPGAAVAVDAVPAAPPLAYSPPGPLLLRLFAADAYDQDKGFVRGPRRGLRRPSFAPPCGQERGLQLRLEAGAGATLLPLPPGWALVRGTLAVDGRAVAAVSATAQGEAVALLPAGGMVTYHACPVPGADAAPAEDEARYRSLPPAFTLPRDLEAAIVARRPAGVGQCVALALALTRDRLAYSAGAETAQRFRNEAGRGGWLERVLRIGAGDCDVVNGFQVLLLRRLGVPARLVIGMVGANGAALPRLHAWAEYLDGGWRVSDATPVTQAGAPVPAATAAGAAAGSPPAALPLPRGGKRLPRALPILLALLAAAALMALLARVRRGRAEPAPAGADEIRGPLLQIARQALLRPELWGADNPLRSHPLLPLANGGRISFLRAEALARRQRLLVTANRNPLALALAAAGAPVLDLSQPAFAPLHAVLEEAIDADMLCRLRPQPPEPGGLLAAVNAIIAPASARTGKAARLPFRRRPRPAPCLLAAGTPEPGILAVDLPVAPLHPPFCFPQRFIAVAPQAEAYRRAAALFRDNPRLATLRFLRLLGEEGALPKDTLPVLLRRAARRLLEDGRE